MYQEEYKRWLAADLEDADLKPELSKIEGNDDEIKERFAVALKFGTAGLRGVLGAGTNRMNIYVVRQATQGLANWVKTQGGTQTVAISYDSRLKSDVFAKTAAGVLAANGIKVRIYDALMPVPALSFATRYYNCNAGVMVTASHNPAKYNGYKAYGPDGCQMTDDAAAIVYEEIQKTDVLTGAKYMSFAEGVEEGLIRFVGDDCKRALYDAIESRQVRPGLCKTAGLKLVYSPLNGSGLVPVTQVLKDIGITDITIVPEQEYPNGYFTTCSYPNPEIFEALELGLNLAKESDADLMLATDPDADRVGIAMKCPDGSYELVSGNEVGVLLLDYICAGRIEKGTMPEKAVAVKSLVSTPLADAVAAHYGVELRNVLTGFKWIGDQIAQLEAAGEVDRFIFGFEESYGYLAGPYVRDKDAVIASMLICEMAAYYRSIGSLRAEGEKKSTILVAEGHKESAILDAEAEKQAAILKAEAQKEATIREAEGKAEAIMKVQQANADGIRFLKEAGADEAVLTMKSLEAFAKAADGKATKIIIPSEIQSIAGLVKSVTEIGADDKKEEK